MTCKARARDRWARLAGGRGRCGAGPPGGRSRSGEAGAPIGTIIIVIIISIIKISNNFICTMRLT